MREHLDAIDDPAANPPMPLNYWEAELGLARTYFQHLLKRDHPQLHADYTRALRARSKAIQDALRSRGLPEDVTERRALRRELAERYDLTTTGVIWHETQVFGSPRKGTTGRPSDWDAPLLKRVEDFLRAWPDGVATTDLARHLGVSPNTVSDACRRGEFDDFSVTYHGRPPEHRPPGARPRRAPMWCIRHKDYA